jgi:hypothetical protein
MTAEAASLVDDPVPPAIDGGWLIETQWLSEQGAGVAHVTTLYAVVPKRPGARAYRVRGRGLRDPLHYGERIDAALDAAAAVAVPASWDDPRPLDRGDSFWLPLSRSTGPAAQADAARQWLQARFGGLLIETSVVGQGERGHLAGRP